MFDSGRWVAGLARKIFPIGPFLVLGWSGTMGAYEHSIKFLFANSPDVMPSVSDFQYLVEKAKLPRGVDASWFIFGISNDCGPVSISHNIAINTPKDGNFNLLGGSGREHFQQFLDEQNIASLDGVDLFPELLGVCAKYLLSQHRQGRFLEEGVGGAFDIIVSGEANFEQLDRVLYVFRDYWDEDEAKLVRSDVENVTKTGRTFSKIEAVYYTTHLGSSLFVGRWHQGGPDFFEVKTPYIQPSPLEKTPHVWGVDYVVETLTHCSGKRPISLLPSSKEYDFQPDANGYSNLKLPMELSEECEQALRAGPEARRTETST
ncbi:hypothetical protein EOS93_14425 [Rhizobium sp. RMa-01]|uniref:hypothetical protein n=1 Tax=unclassified Rhizobium TaxID=2613769 RepID=UPI0008D90C3A|nr:MULTISPECIES: hypothetical protein [unclassified Rhizobium]OHV18720.1 hypothetical protein BBJ66_18240 [Rhizobium sp. RSm-3]RVU10567.1 hypothetical protein EOS93_14425 [Rhizobium sp. RMa-01]